ncbi:phosphoenolpyruvate carboxylase type 1 [Humitalea rosea]|uniref:Phosphoenolpyruvate carboxylase n=1 Tax=Humitalea rosea TaxID=990373 RepID=A0A2W7HZ92_9PROT|nr:phosphoenolpyruvate carboxylase [Humitalea rosea]PZW39814.1 phosphoenolpyruvate carboxylase type 1 [Humitalea rosea]
MPDTNLAPSASTLTTQEIEAELLAGLRSARAAAAADPFGDPVLATALSVSRRLDDGRLDEVSVAALIQRLADAAAADRAARLDAYLGTRDRNGVAALAVRLVRPDPDDSPVPFAAFRRAIERPRFAAVFTAHPTFAHPPATYAAIADAASGGAPQTGLRHRPDAPTLAQEFDAVVLAIQNGRGALDELAGALLDAATTTWPDRWHSLNPAPVLLTSWVGYDTDGRTDIGWYDTLRFRLTMKRLQLARLRTQIAEAGACAAPLLARLAEAEAAVAAQIAACPPDGEARATADFAALLVGEREVALVTPAALLPLFEAAIAAAPEAAIKRRLVVARAGLLAQGLALAHTHVRLNAQQIHNALRQRLDEAANPEDPAQRRGLLARINAALAECVPQPVDFGALLTEQASAARLMMTVAQIAKHIDGATPVRFLIAETETGYTLLAALWLARQCGIEHLIEISPLFETAEALERGERVLEEALRSPHYRAYVQAQGRICLQFGYSDSGRYVGQIPASYLAERLKLRLAEQLKRHGLSGIEVVLFDTHGESVGRGAHPGSLADRFEYLTPPAVRQSLANAGVMLREEAAFQGGDGYMLFGTPALARRVIARIAGHAFAEVPKAPDPIYAESDWAADFFATARREMQELVEDPGYAALLGAFGPGLLDKTGSRPAARQSDGVGGAARITHPSQLRAIPNNAILQQLGYMANSLHGLGRAAEANPETFTDLCERSPRFARALGIATRAAACSDLGVLRAAIGSLDPGPWLDRAGFTHRPGRREALMAVAEALERLDLSAPIRRMFRRLQADHLALVAAWPEGLPAMPDRLVLLHALRLALIQRIWLLAVSLPDFSPRHGATRETVLNAMLRLEVEPALRVLEQIFPVGAGPAQGLDFHEVAAPRGGHDYSREHATIFQPIRRLFGLTRDCAAAIAHEVGAFG